MAWAARLLPARDADDRGEKPERIRAALISQCSTFHLGCQALGLSREGLGSAEQRLSSQFKL